MSFREVVWRLQKKLEQLYAHWARTWRQNHYQRSSQSGREILRTMDEISFYALSDIQPEIILGCWRDACIRSAEKSLRHEWSCLALESVDLEKTVSWNHEYKQDLELPLRFGPMMDYRDSSTYGDFKYFWELPRLQHLITLSKAYYLTGEKRYAEEVAVQIQSFVEQSPYLLGVNWIMPMETGIRLVSICWISAFLKEYLHKQPELCNSIEQIVRSHVDYVATNYAKFSSANNHLVGEAGGVFLASICFGHIHRMPVRRKQAWDILCREIQLQHFSDGVNQEQAVHYQLFALEFFFLAAILADRNQIPVPEDYWQMLQKSSSFIAALADEHCHCPEIGDNDDGRAVLLSEEDPNPVREILSLAAVLFKRGDFKTKAGCLHESVFWLLSPKAVKQYEELPSESSPEVQRFDQGGYYIFENRNNGIPVKLIFDCGPLGFGALAAHGHADALHFVLDVAGLPLLIDPGTYTYIAEDPYRNYFRSTAAHNAVEVDGQNQSEILGPFLWGRRAKSRVIQYRNTDTEFYLSGCHDGYQYLEDPVLHHRSIRLDKIKGFLQVQDEIDANAYHEIRIFYHIAPEWQVTKAEQNQWKMIHSRNGKTVRMIPEGRIDFQSYQGSEDPILGWASDRYDRKYPITTLVGSAEITNNDCFITQWENLC